MSTVSYIIFLLISIQAFLTEAGNVVIFPMMSRSQLLNAARIATILADDGHNVTIAIPTNDEPDIKKSPAYNLIFYKTSMSRENEQRVYKEAAKFTPLNLLLGRAPTTMTEVMTQRCRGVLFDEEFIEMVSDLKLDMAIVHLAVPCIIAPLVRMGVPFMDFCSVPLMHAMCGYPHRVPAPPSYVPDGPYQSIPHSFSERLLNSLIYTFMPLVFNYGIIGPVQKELYRYQEQHQLPYENTVQLRSKASFLLVHGDLSFETVRPSLPKVVYIGGIQCDAPKPLEGELKDFIDGVSDDYLGTIVFSLGGVLNTEGLPRHFIDTFMEVFRQMPTYQVVWKLKSIPDGLVVPNNVKIVDWMPQQDLLGHTKTKLFITHGGIQGSFESICHGVATLGIGIFGDQVGNIQVLKRKGMALSIDDYKTITQEEVKGKLNQLLTDGTFQQNAINARSLFHDQPSTVDERLKFAVEYTIRHKGAHHLTSQAALSMHWFHYYSLDVYLFLIITAWIILVIGYFLVKTCWRCCVSICRSSKAKVE